MKRAIFASILAFTIQVGNESLEEPGFEKVSDHCYCFQLKEGENVAAVITEEGVLIVDPPREPDVSLVVDALKRVTSEAVRWVVFTDHHFSRTAGARFFAEHGAQLLASTQLHTLATTTRRSEFEATTVSSSADRDAGEPPSFPWLIFNPQMHLFPSNLEIRVTAVRRKAHTGGDVFLYVPDEKVLFVGDLYEAGRYPDIDIASEGSALGWIDGFKQVIDSVPLLKSAIPPAKSESEPEEEKTLEEEIVVVSARGGVSNLQDMKDLLEICQKLRRDISRAVKAGRTCDSFLASPASDAYYNYENLEPYAAQLFAELTAAASPIKSSD